MGKKRKTKKDKVILRLKRELARQEKKKGEGYSLPNAQPPKKAPKIKKEHDVKVSEDIKKYQLVRKDLTRSLALAILIIALEFFIYWRWG